MIASAGRRSFVLAQLLPAMPEEITVHQDTTLSTGRMSFVLSVGGVIALLTAGMMYGTMRTEVSNMRDEVSSLRTEVQTRESKDAVALMFGDLRARLSRIESLLDRGANTVPRVP